MEQNFSFIAKTFVFWTIYLRVNEPLEKSVNEPSSNLYLLCML